MKPLAEMFGSLDPTLNGAAKQKDSSHDSLTLCLVIHTTGKRTTTSNGHLRAGPRRGRGRFHLARL